MAEIDVLAGLNKLKSELEIRNQKKEKEREVVNSDNNREGMERVKDLMKGVEKRNQQGIVNIS